MYIHPKRLSGAFEDYTLYESVSLLSGNILHPCFSSTIDSSSNTCSLVSVVVVALFPSWGWLQCFSSWLVDNCHSCNSNDIGNGKEESLLVYQLGFIRNIIIIIKALLLLLLVD
jgi:hypothetical protein